MCQPGGLTTPRPLLKWPLQQSRAAARDITPRSFPYAVRPAAGRVCRHPRRHGGSLPRPPAWPKPGHPCFKGEEGGGERLCTHSPFPTHISNLTPENPVGAGGLRTSPSRSATILQQAQTKNAGAQHHHIPEHCHIPEHRLALPPDPRMPSLRANPHARLCLHVSETH